MTGCDADGWQTIAFDEPYQWDGESNIVVAVYVACPPYFFPSNSTLEYYGSYVEGMSGYSTSYDRMTASQFFNSSPLQCGVRPDIRFSIEDLAVSIGDIDIQYATGTAVQPQVSASLDGKVLENGRDYTISYEDNVNPGTGYVIVEGTGNFTGSRRIPFVIASASFAEGGKLDVPVGDTSAKTIQSPYVPNKTSSDGSTHFGVTQALYKASEIAAAGGARGLIDGISYYSLGGTSFSPKKVKVYIEPTETKALWYASSSFSGIAEYRPLFSYEKATLVYEGTPTLGRNEGWEQLDLSTPFEYDGESNILVTVVTDSGESGARISYSADKVKGMFLSGCEGKGSKDAFESSTRPSIKFTMRANLSYATDLDIATQPYRGVPVMPKPLLKFGERTLEEGVDYELSYENNDAVGTGTVIATGIGNYSGEKRMQFAIGNDIASATSLPIADEVYCGKAIKPKPVLSFGGRTLEEGVDYELSYERNVNAGVGIVVATGIGCQFAGEKRIEFHIERADIADESVRAISAQDYTGLPLEPVLYVGNLEPRVDYDLSYEDNVEIGTATVVATGKGNYKGVRKSTFRIVKADIHDDHTVIVNDNNAGGYNLKYGETAVWGFTLSANSYIKIQTMHVSTLPSGDALGLVLRDDDGKIVYEWNEPVLPNINETERFYLPKGKWHLSVKALGSQTYGDDLPVIVRVDGWKTIEDIVEKEQNGSMSSATPMELNSFWAAGTLYDPAKKVEGSYADEDYWSFDIENSSKIKLKFSPSSGVCNFCLLDEAGNMMEKDGAVLSGTTRGGKNQMTLDCGRFPAGRYYVRVSLGDVSSWGSHYSIEVDADSSISLDDCSIAVDQCSVFNGSAQKPLVVMKNASGILLIEGQDYSVEYRDNVKAGYGTVVVKGMGAYSGERSETFRIAPAVIDEPEAVANLVYNAHEQVGVAHGDLLSVSGGSATDAGSYTATVSLVDKQNYEWSGSGNSDDIEVSWSIAKALLTSSMVSDVPSSMEATGSQLAPEPIVTFNGKTLVQGVDYALSYGENVSPGKGTVTVTAVEGGNFTGSATVEFDIEKKAEPAPEPQQFAVIYHLDGGANATDNPATYMAGTAVPLANPTKEGFEFQGWYADAEFTVRVTEIPADASGDVELWAKWKEHKPAPVFTDVDYSSWYGDAVSYVASRGLITGYSGTTLFGVGDVLTRAQLATILWRNACPDEYASYDPETAKDTTGIDGSADGMYYTAAANWAVKNGVITGFDREDGSKDFAADDDVSFEQLITILSRLCATPEELSAAGSDLSAFADGDLASSWSRGAFAWAAAKGLVQGYDEPTGKYLRPGDPVARERVAVVLMRAFEMGIMK